MKHDTPLILDYLTGNMFIFKEREFLKIDTAKEHYNYKIHVQKRGNCFYIIKYKNGGCARQGKKFLMRLGF